MRPTAVTACLRCRRCYADRLPARFRPQIELARKRGTRRHERLAYSKISRSRDRATKEKRPGVFAAREHSRGQESRDRRKGLRVASERKGSASATSARRFFRGREFFRAGKPGRSSTAGVTEAGELRSRRIDLSCGRARPTVAFPFNGARLPRRLSPSLSLFLLRLIKFLAGDMAVRMSQRVFAANTKLPFLGSRGVLTNSRESLDRSDGHP